MSVLTAGVVLFFANATACPLGMAAANVSNPRPVIAHDRYNNPRTLAIPKGVWCAPAVAH